MAEDLDVSGRGWLVAALMALVSIGLLVYLSGEALYMWYVMVYEIAGFQSRTLLQGSAILLAIASIAVYAHLEKRGQHRPPFRRWRATACLVAAGCALGAILYIGEAAARLGIVGGRALQLATEGAARAAVTVGIWVGVSISVWMLSLACVDAVIRARQWHFDHRQ